MDRRCLNVVLSYLTLAACTHTSSQVLTSTEVADGGKQAFEHLDVLERHIAGDIAGRLGWFEIDGMPDTNYQVHVYRGGPNIGTLVQGGPNNLVNSTACKPASELETRPLNVFAAYNVSSKLALELGLPIPSVPTSLTAGRELTAAYILSDATIKFLPADELAKLKEAPECKKRIDKFDGKEAWIVRGLILAKRSYRFYLKGTGGATLPIPTTDGFSLTGETSSESKSDDSAAREYFMIPTPLAMNNVPEVSGALPPPSCEGQNRRVYIQRDEADGLDTATAIQNALSNRYFRVVNEVELIKSERMPTTPQIRYFHDADESAAKCALTILRLKYPKAEVRRLNLVAPEGQLELWLERKN